ERVGRRHALDAIGSITPRMELVVSQVRLAGQVRSDVMLVGERGTGKEWLARVLHGQRLERERVFVSLNCARLPPSAIADFLMDKTGLVCREDIGTLYLHEPGCLPRDLQGKLCDFLEVVPTPGDKNPGSAHPSKMRPRVVAGCTIGPAEQVRSGR